MSRTLLFTLLVATLAGACGRAETHPVARSAAPPAGTVLTVHAAPVEATLDASGVAAPFAQATLSTKLMGTVTAVRVREGDPVHAGDVLLTIDARDLAAKGSQVAAGEAEAEAVLREAKTHAERMRSLFAEEAAPKAQLDAAETSLARAQAAVLTARASAAELGAVRDYSVVRAPFDGVVVRRMVDAGAFAAPGAPLLTVEDSRRLRITVSAWPEAVRGLARGARLAAAIEHAPAEAVVEGVVPAAGNLYAVNAIVDNRAGAYMAGSAATLSLPQRTRPAIVIPASAVHREGDLTGVYVRGGGSTDLRWVRLGGDLGTGVEVLAGLREGDQIVVPTTLVEGR